MIGSFSSNINQELLKPLQNFSTLLCLVYVFSNIVHIFFYPLITLALSSANSSQNLFFFCYHESAVGLVVDVCNVIFVRYINDFDLKYFNQALSNFSVFLNFLLLIFMRSSRFKFTLKYLTKRHIYEGVDGRVFCEFKEKKYYF